jgi:hypothetical protein
MFIVLLPMIVFFFLVLGAIAFLVCILIPPGRKYALSTALWFATWGLGCTAFLILAVLGLAAGGFAFRAAQMHWDDAPKLFSAIGWGFVISAGVVICAIAGGTAWLHQVLIHRSTFMLFRLYATFVTAGIGSVIGFAFLLLSLASAPEPNIKFAAAFSIPILTAAFGTVAYKHAHALRGNAPTRLTWITPDEFAGPVEPKG